MELNKIKEWYWVDRVPLWIRPFYLALSYFVGYVHYYFFHIFVNWTSKITFIGEDPRKTDTKCIYTIWHTEIFAFFTAFGKIPNLILINHPLWYMKSTHVALGLFGIKKMFLGSTGYGGKEAAQELTQELKKGIYSTLINPDGPTGPYKKINKGIFHIAMDSGLPIIPIRVSSRPDLRLSGWDRKLIPIPFSRITVRIGKPILINKKNIERAPALLWKGLEKDFQ